MVLLLACLFIVATAIGSYVAFAVAGALLDTSSDGSAVGSTRAQL